MHVWGLKSWSFVIKNRKSFHLVRVFSRQWRLINFRMHRSDDCRSWNFITNINNWAHVSFWFWKKLNFLHFLPCKEIISCMFYLKDYQLQWISFWLNQFIRIYIIDILSILDSNKATGPDKISNKMIISIKNEIAKPLCLLFSKSLRLKNIHVLENCSCDSFIQKRRQILTLKL